VSHPMKRIRLSTVLLLVVILVLGYVSIEAQRREARLRAALAAYQRRSERHIVSLLSGGWFPIEWPDGTPLEEAIRQITVFTSRSQARHFPKGVPVYVDPNALRRAGKTLKSPMKGLPADPNGAFALRQKLQSVLEPMGLAFEVKDGSILITTPDAIENPDRLELKEKEDEGIAP
jgi:hypothetical protein